MKPFALLSLALLAVSIRADQAYVLEPDYGQNLLGVTLTRSEPQTEFWMPVWREGDYEAFLYHNSVVIARFFLKGKEVPANKTRTGAWRIAQGADEVRYVVRPTVGNFSPNFSAARGEAWVSGPVFGVLGSPEGTQKVTILGEEPFALYTSLDHATVEGGATFTAKDYQELLDSPFLFSPRARLSEFLVDGKLHAFVAFGVNEEIDPRPFADLSMKVVEETKAIFGSLPYERYVFFGDFLGRGGGLEHRASTRLGLSSPNADAAASLIAHEYFHAYNVKKIIPEEFAQLDFRKPPVTDSLWWLEGVTDYYAWVILRRAGIRSEEQMTAWLNRSIWSLERGTARQRVTLKESSRRVWEAEGSQGYGGLSYYLKGKLAGFVLDLAIREETGGANSLDDVVKALWEESKTSKGYAPGRIRELVRKTGGPRSEALYIKVTETTEDIPWNDLLKPYGKMLFENRIVDRPEAKEEEKELWKSWPFAAKPRNSFRV